MKKLLLLALTAVVIGGCVKHYEELLKRYKDYKERKNEYTNYAAEALA